MDVRPVRDESGRVQGTAPVPPAADPHTAAEALRLRLVHDAPREAQQPRRVPASARHEALPPGSADSAD